ncbi:CAP domain-containing protein [Arthrobacter sp. ZGTC212]|uniref:CAP domain-containing protein n=1 Tax=Arthrobacter sp. ZGTC212 TaxID=2058899 RepID=UPI000CE3D8AF|nr:CAP domain-containing protein [Arthrobacter sp. ZGTC212]
MRFKKLVGVFTALAIALMTALISIPSAAASSADAQFANRLYVLINDYRAQHALAPLRWNDQMSAESQSWTQQSADQANIYGAGVFQHSPGSYAFPENIVWNMSADQAFSWWVNSPAHRANMLRAADTDIGIGAVQLTAGPNQGAYLATAKFGQYAVSPQDEAAAREAAARAAAEKAAAEAAARAAAEEAAAQEAAARAAEEKAAAEAAARAAAEEAAANAAREAEAAKAAAEAAAKAAAEEAAAKKAAEEAAAAKPDTAPVEDKAAEEAAAQKAAEEAAAANKAAQEAAAQKAAEEAAAQTAQKAAEEAAAQERQAAEEQAAADEALAQEAAAAEAAAQEAAAQEAANEAAAKEAAQTAAAAQAAAEEEARRAAEQAKAKAAAGVATVEQVTLGQDTLLTEAARGTVTAAASGSQLRISGLNGGTAYEVVLPSAGVNLGEVTADTQGSLAVAVPAVLAAGEHKVALFRNGALAGWTTFTVEQAVTVLAAQPVPAAADGTAELAATGLNAAQLAIGGIGALMALTGGAALVALQRQRAASVR